MMSEVRTKEVTLGSMRSQGVRGLLVRCSTCAHSVPISADQWPDDMRLSDLEPHFVCKVCGHRGADAAPDFGKRVVSRLAYAQPSELRSRFR
jgi:hypothetical protein